MEIIKMRGCLYQIVPMPDGEGYQKLNDKEIVEGYDQLRQQVATLQKEALKVYQLDGSCVEMETAEQVIEFRKGCAKLLLTQAQEIDTLQKDNDNLKAEVVELIGQRDIDLTYWSNMAIENKHRPVEEAARLFSDICNILSSVQKEDECLFVTAMNLADRAEKAEAEVETLSEQICDECLEYKDDGTPFTTYGWNENRVEGQIPCICISESGAYQVIEEERNNLRELLFSIGKYATGEDQLDAFDDTQALLELAKLVGAYDDPPHYSPEALNHKEK